MLSIHSWQLLWILTVVESTIGDGVKWLGPTGKVLCHCVYNGCLFDEGEPRCDYGCKQEQIGFFCQYSDVSIRVNQIYPVLSDLNSQTCLDKHVNEVRISIEPSMIRIVEITYREKVDIKDVLIRFETYSGIKQCRGTYFVYFVKYLHLECLEIFKVKSVLISGSSNKDMCETYVGRGRNMAVKTAVGQQGTEFTLTRDWAMTDGDLSLDKKMCTAVSLTSTNPVVFITIDFAVTVNNIVLTIGAGTGVDTYQLSTENKNGTTIWREETPAFFNRSMTFFHDMGLAQVSKISISFQKSFQTSAEINICELEAYGECFPGKHGLECESDCSDRCKDKLCTVDGLCFNCTSTNYTGYKCCSINCAGNQSCHMNGSCIYGCINGYYGLTCERVCNVNCGGNSSCERTSGNCFMGCKDGYYGSTCSKKWCSLFCANDGSCARNGTCIHGCKTGYFGNKCNKKGLQAVDGKWTCHCTEGNCSNKNNMCPTEQCVKGWFAQSCQYRDAGAYAEMSHPDLNDNNDLTCYDSPNNSVTARWDEDFVVSWARLVFNTEGEFIFMRCCNLK